MFLNLIAENRSSGFLSAFPHPAKELKHYRNFPIILI